MGRQGPRGPRTPGEGCEHSMVDSFDTSWGRDLTVPAPQRLYSVLKASVVLGGKDLAVPAPPGPLSDL